MRRYPYVLLALGLAVGAWAGATADLGTVLADYVGIGDTTPDEVVDITGTMSIGNAAGAPAVKYYTPSAAGGTADTLRVWAGHVNGVADDAVFTIASGLDTSITYDVTLTGMAASATYTGVFSVNMAVGVGGVDATRCSAGTNCAYRTDACTGGTGTDVFMTLCNPASGATRSLIVENRMGSAMDISWLIYGGGQ